MITESLKFVVRTTASESRAEDRLPAPIRTGPEKHGKALVRNEKPARAAGGSRMQQTISCLLFFVTLFLECVQFMLCPETWRVHFSSSSLWKPNHHHLGHLGRSSEGVLLLLQEGRWSADHFDQPQWTSPVRMLSRFGAVIWELNFDEFYQAVRFRRSVNMQTWLKEKTWVKDRKRTCSMGYSICFF